MKHEKAGKSRVLLSAGVLFVLLSCSTNKALQTNHSVQLVEVGAGWANNSVNVVPFRKNALVTFEDTQFIAYYDAEQHVVLGKRKQGETAWLLHKTEYKGNAADAHNAISIAVDGDGFLHVAWDHHNNALRYAKGKAPFSFELGAKTAMTGKAEDRLSYPEFYSLTNGNLLFFYRDGGSGGGNMVINRYNTATKKWEQLHRSLIDGERQRNAYWQACTDQMGTIHVSWVWRESPDVASNHDLCYARSRDGGETWEKSNGEKYALPITAATAEYAVRIPQKSELINQTSMMADQAGNPFIATYWREQGSQVPTYHVVYRDDKMWKTANLAIRQTPFSLSGMGSKRIPIARPQILVSGSGGKAFVSLVYRDEERGSKVSVATANPIEKENWKVADLTTFSVGSWEPVMDPAFWNKTNQLHLFVQQVEQVDGEGKADIPPQKVYVLEWNPKIK
ncbi:MAG TPA: BNR repeat-containing protein [Flavisolibacter sp.]|jgi:hypothetical protein|nr:BNR repeat-containing protein [Flavisolibacter sp.]